MKKTGLFVVLLTMCGGLAAQNIEVSSDSVKNEVDSLSVNASMDSLRTPLEKKSSSGSEKEGGITSFGSTKFLADVAEFPSGL